MRSKFHPLPIGYKGTISRDNNTQSKDGVVKGTQFIILLPEYLEQ